MIRAVLGRSATAFLIAALVAGCGEAGPDEVADGAAPRKPAVVSSPSRAPAPRVVDLRWPTPNDVFLRGGGPEQFVQPTASGEITSGLFGSVRSGGRQFHEGLDLFPVERDKRGEALDPVWAVLPGVVSHVSPREGASSYGRYVVLEHPEESPPVYTLYAHLASIEPGLKSGQSVAAGAPLGIMGRSAGGYKIPKERAHLHFEIGVRMTDQFQQWYKARGFGSPNEHGLWNGMNLMGLDPLEFFGRRRAGALHKLDDVFAAVPTAVTLRVAVAEEPDFVRRYPSLVKADTTLSAGLASGWEIELSATGVPLRWRRLTAADLVGWRPGEMRILAQDDALLAANRGRKLVVQRRGAPAAGDDLRTVLEQLFGKSVRL
jgi:hypothetical protein